MATAKNPLPGLDARARMRVAMPSKTWSSGDVIVHSSVEQVDAPQVYAALRRLVSDVPLPRRPREQYPPILVARFRGHRCGLWSLRQQE